MTDEQLALALITTYKSRGIDMSSILDNPIFEKLPAAVRIDAIQKYAKDIEAGINPRLNHVDYKRIASNAGFDGVAGAMAGATIGGMLASQAPHGVSTLGATLVGAGIMGTLGAMVGGMKAYGAVQDRSTLRNAMSETSADPSVQNALYALSVNHSFAPTRVLRDNILGRIGDTVRETGHGQLPKVLVTLNDQKMLEHALANPQ